MMMRIGMPNHKRAEKYRSTAQSLLSAQGVDCQWIFSGSQDESISANLLLLESALLSGEVDAFLFPHKYLPTTQRDGIVITASGPREDAEEVLFIHPNAYDNKAIFKLKPQASVKASTVLQQTQLTDYRSDTLIDYMPNTLASFDLLLHGQTDAVLVSGDELNLIDYKGIDLQKVLLNPREFVPAPAQGVWAWLCNRGDTQTRRALRPLHHTEISSLTNVERSVLRQFNDEAQLAAHCERDGNGFVHVFAARFVDGTLKRARISSSTTFGLSDAIIKQLI